MDGARHDGEGRAQPGRASVVNRVSGGMVQKSVKVVIMKGLSLKANMKKTTLNLCRVKEVKKYHSFPPKSPQITPESRKGFRK